jgi:hypothetical protein
MSTDWPHERLLDGALAAIGKTIGLDVNAYNTAIVE